MARVDRLGRALAGSQLQMQIYVNRRKSELESAILSALPVLAAENPTFTWVSPLEGSLFREYRDGRFLWALGQSGLRTSLQQFWPRGGPVWDALAQVTLSQQRAGVLLVEAKSYPGEMHRKAGSRASPASLPKILASLAAAKGWFGVQASVDWNGTLYQLANRLAHVHFFHAHGVPVWFVNLCFVDDPHSPTDRTTWTSALAAARVQQGMTAHNAVGDVFLPALQRSVLVP
jgi:hypothetical protein